MPYSKGSPPDRIKMLPSHAQDVWVSAFNSAFGQYKDETSANKVAWAAVKKAGYAQKDGKWVKADEDKDDETVGKKKSREDIELACKNKKLDESASIYYSVKLGESKELEIMRTGKWEHPTLGQLEITLNDLDLFVKSFNDNVRGIDIAIDLEHGVTEKKGAAAGWVRSLRKNGNSLLATVEWTELGEEVVKSEQYKYFSPEFKFAYKDDETGKIYRNVLLGGGLTNRPFIKGMEQVVLMSEDVGNELDNLTIKIKEENKMNRQLLEALMLSETSTQVEIDAAIKANLDLTVTLSEENKTLKEDKTSLETEKAKADAEIITLSEKVKTLEAGKTDVEKANIKLSERVEAVEKNLTEKEWEAIETVALSEGKMTKPMAEKYKALYMKDKETAKDLISSLQPVIELGEKGSTSSKDESSNAIKLFEDEVIKAVREKK